MAGNNSRCPFYRGVSVIEVSIKRESTVPANLWSILMSSSLNVCKKILYCASYFQLSSQCFIWWWDTVFHTWYITWDSYHTFTGVLYELSKLGVFSLYFPVWFRLSPRNIVQFRNYRWYHRTWLCLIFSTHFSVSGLPRQKRLQGRLLSIWTSDESLLVSWPHLTTCTTVCWESKSSLAL